MNKATQEFSYKLLVEGKNDCCVVASLCEHYKVKENFNIMPCDGISNVLEQFKLMLSNPLVYQRIGVMVDADTDIKKRWTQLTDILTRSGKYDCDKLKLPTGGLVLTPRDSNDAIVGIWIMPDNQLKGNLEDFVVQLAPPNDVLMKEADNVLGELEAKEIQRYKATHRTKAKIHTFLAWQKKPGCPVGAAITAKILNPDSAQAKPFIEWLNNLFVEINCN